MKSVTQRLLALVAMLLVSVPAWAQTVNVTFQADLRPAVANCRFDPATGSVFLRGSAFGEWAEASAVQLSDTDGDRIYTTTQAVAPGVAINYKFLAPNVTGWEDGGDRTFTPTSDASQTVEAVVPNVPNYGTNGCGAVNRNYEVEFQIDVSTLSATVFNPTQDTLFVAGGMTGWGDSKDRLTPSFDNADIYTTVINIDNFPSPGEQFYKFIVRKANAPGVIGRGPISWESPRNTNPDNNRRITYTGTEPDTDADGRLEKTEGPFYWSDVPPTEVLSAATTVTLEVDLGPAIYYAAAHSNMVPGATTAFSRTIFLNGPVMQAADGMTDWAAWTPEGLGAMPTRQFLDDGANGDAAANDGIYSKTVTFPRGSAIVQKGKFGADAGDNESGFAADRYIDLSKATGGRLRMVFGAVVLQSGKVTDLRGPGAAPFGYDPYICIPADSLSATVSPTGACARPSASEPVDAPATSRFTVETVYPNPTTGATRLRYALPSAMAVKVEVFDLLGRRIETVVDETQAAGTYNAVFDARGLTTGVYVYRVSAGGQVQNRTFVVNR